MPPIPLEHYCVQVIDDHHMMRLGLIALARAASSLRIEWLEAGNLGDALAAHRQADKVDLVLLDLNLPDTQGLQGLRTFLGEFPRSKVAVFSATEDEFVVGQALALGAVCFLPKSASAHKTLRAIESLLTGPGYPADAPAEPGAQVFLASGSGDALTAVNSAVSTVLRAQAATLNPTQLKVLELVLAGMNNREIASALSLALGTVKNTVSSIFLALDVRSRAHLISVFR